MRVNIWSTAYALLWDNVCQYVCACVWYQSLFCVSQTNWIKISTKIYVALPAAEAEANPDHLKVNWELYDFRSGTLSLCNLYDCDYEKDWFRWVHKFLSGIITLACEKKFVRVCFAFPTAAAKQCKYSNLDQKVNFSQSWTDSGYATVWPNQMWHHQFLNVWKVKEMKLFHSWYQKCALCAINTFSKLYYCHLVHFMVFC